MVSAEFVRRVLVVEDEPMLLGLVCAKLTADGFVVRPAGSAAEAREVAKGFDPDIALLDIQLGTGPTGIDLAAILRIEYPNIGVVFLTHIPEPRLAGLSNNDIPKGSAYLVKDRIADPGVLVAAIEAAARNKVGNEFRDDKTFEHRMRSVSNSQIAVLRMVSLGMSNTEIAAQRKTTIRAVENLISRAIAAAGITATTSENMRVVAAREFIRTVGMLDKP